MRICSCHKFSFQVYRVLGWTDTQGQAPGHLSCSLRESHTQSPTPPPPTSACLTLLNVCRLEARLTSRSKLVFTWVPWQQARGLVQHELSTNIYWKDRWRQNSFTKEVLYHLAQLYLGALLYEIHLVKYIHTGAQSPLYLTLETHLLLSLTEDSVILKGLSPYSFMRVFLHANAHVTPNLLLWHGSKWTRGVGKDSQRGGKDIRFGDELIMSQSVYSVRGKAASGSPR